MVSTMPRKGSWIWEGEMGRVTGVEPATFGTTNRRSNQLSYTRHTTSRPGLNAIWREKSSRVFIIEGDKSPSGACASHTLLIFRREMDIMADFHNFNDHIRRLFEVLGDEKDVRFVVRRAGMGMQL